MSIISIRDIYIYVLLYLLIFSGELSACYARCFDPDRDYFNLDQIDSDLADLDFAILDQIEIHPMIIQYSS